MTVEEVLTAKVGSYVNQWFRPSFSHLFLSLETISVPESIKPIPKRWVEDIEVQIDADGFLAGDDDLLVEANPADSWSLDEGKRRLREALERLDLNEELIMNPGLSKMGKNELAARKRRVKQELKRYDSDFRRQFRRLPSHSEKEPMRPLYVYYRRLKTLIAQAEQQGRSGSRRSDGGPVGDAGAYAGRDGGEGIEMGMDRRPSCAGGLDVVEDQIAELEERIHTLQADKGVVRGKLQAFQEKFVRENQRKIRYHKDILPILREYRMYKQLKEDIMKAEGQLRELQAKV